MKNEHSDMIASKYLGKKIMSMKDVESVTTLAQETMAKVEETDRKIDVTEKRLFIVMFLLCTIVFVYLIASVFLLESFGNGLLNIFGSVGVFCSVLLFINIEYRRSVMNKELKNLKDANDYLGFFISNPIKKEFNFNTKRWKFVNNLINKEHLEIVEIEKSLIYAPRIEKGLDLPSVFFYDTLSDIYFTYYKDELSQVKVMEVTKEGKVTIKDTDMILDIA